MAKLINCIVCNREISSEATSCPGCGQTQVPLSEKRMRWTGIATGLCVFAYIIIEISRSGNLQSIISFISQ